MFKNKWNYSGILGQIFLWALLSCVLVLFLFPLYYLIVSASLPIAKQDNPDASLKISGYFFQNFKQSIDKNFWNGLGNSLGTIILVNFFRLTLYTLGIFGIWWASKKAKIIFLSIFAIVSMIPEVTTYIGLAKLLNANNIVDKSPIFSLVINQIFSFFSFYFLYKSIETVSQDKLQLAKIDNLSTFSQFKLIFFPQLKMGYYLIIIFSSIQAWNDYLWPHFIFAFRDQATISIWFSYTGQNPQGTFQNIQAAGSLFAVLVPLTIYLIFSPFINKVNSKSFS
ncbi:ABC transporter permease subunit [Mesomycoplasma bovoculi]|uniref:Glycerol ABC transporter, permease protein n=1 Tax=Mesomycoplasma bovoculi M165/69 TaxID=743966 RepID=W5UUB1_9BACT|nr:ABC transporter permease subunit [Mesomycoplasma bovoculi]AHH45395.1 glycerol ABC transporter, permease protein [Mesomycoplasma bovoculi M165/69]